MARQATCPQGHVHTITVERAKVGECYARNGNVHNPTPKYTFTALVGGRVVCSCSLQRRAVLVAVEYITSGEVDE